MIGKEKASEIRSQLRKAANRSDAEILAWFESETAKAKKMPVGADTAVESLNLLLNSLVRETERTTRSRKKKKLPAVARAT